MFIYVYIYELLWTIKYSQFFRFNSDTMIYFDPMKYLPNAETFTRLLDVVQSSNIFPKPLALPTAILNFPKPEV